MFIFIIILTSFLFPANKNEIQKIKTINKVNFYTLKDSSIYTIYEEFYENKIYIKKYISDKKQFKTLDNFNIKQFKNFDSIIYLENESNVYYYNIFNGDFLELDYDKSLNQEIDELKSLKIDNQIVYKIGNKLYINGKVKDSLVVDFIEFNNNLFYLTNIQGKILLKDKSSKTLNRFEGTDNNSLAILDGKLSIINYYEDRQLIVKLDKDFIIEKEYWLNTKNKIVFDKNTLYFYDFIDLSFKSVSKVVKKMFEFKGDFEDFKVVNNKIYIKGKSNVRLFDLDGDELGEYSFNERIIDFQAKSNEIYIFTDNNLSIFQITENNFWFFQEFYEKYLSYLIYIILIYYIFKFWLKYRQRQIIFHTIFDLTSSGIIIHVNEKGELTNLNQNARKVLMLPDSVKMGEYYKKYIKQESLIELGELIGKSVHTKNSFKQKIIIKDGSEVIDLMCNVNPIQNFTGKFKGILITAIDISEELESKRMSNWAQLAHDMQTNLSTIKLNAEQLSLEDQINQNRQNKIIHQTNLLVKRVRDIVTVGRSNNLNKSLYSSEEIYNDLINEFDLDSFKNIEVKPKIEKFNFVCDKEKIIRALRNAFENALKILNSENGTIEVIIRRDNRNVFLIIKDSGLGMNEETIKKMKDPYFTTKGEKGGSGIGTIIMQKVMEQHGGEFLIQSKLNVGTEVIFKIPNIKN